MEKLRCCSMITISMVALMLLVPVTLVSGQITTSCTSALINGFTPCFNYLSSSSNVSRTPSPECCKSFADIVSSSADCACFILMGYVPFSIPFNRTLALTLPKACKSLSAPFQCSGNSNPVSGPPGSPFTPAPPLAPLASPPPPPEPAPATPSPDQAGVRPLVLPSSATTTRPSHFQSSAIFALRVAGTVMLVKI